MLRLAAVKRLAVHKALEIDHNGVAFLGRTLNGLDAGIALRHLCDLRIDLRLGDGNGLLRHLDALIFAERDLRIQLRGDGQDHVAVFVGVHVRDGRSADRLDLLLNDCLCVDLREDLIDGILIEDRRAVHGLDHLSGGLALAEAGDHDVLAALGVRLVQRILKFRLFDLDNDLCAALFSFYALYVHVISSYVVRPHRSRSSPILNP